MKKKEKNMERKGCGQIVNMAGGLVRALFVQKRKRLQSRDCTDKNGSEISYRISIEDPRKLPFPWEIPRVKVYHCRDCPAQITEDQAKRTYREEGRALCVRCEGREHGIEIQGFE